jgi:hypothetical protein
VPSVDRLFGHIEVFAKFVPGEVASHESIVAVAFGRSRARVRHGAHCTSVREVLYAASSERSRIDGPLPSLAGKSSTPPAFAGFSRGIRVGRRTVVEHGR